MDTGMSGGYRNECADTGMIRPGSFIHDLLMILKDRHHTRTLHKWFDWLLA